MISEIHFPFITGALQISEKFAIEVRAKFAQKFELLKSGANLENVEKESFDTVFVKEQGQLVESYRLDREVPQSSVAVLNLVGMMTVERTWYSDGVRNLERQIREASENPNIVATVIRGNTGGGHGMAGQIVRNAISDSKIPVVVHADNLLSAGQSATLTADYRMSSGSKSEFGSFGSMISINKEYAKYEKDALDEIYSETSQNKNSEWREYQKGNKQPYIDYVTKQDGFFMEAARKHLPLKGNISETLDGRDFFSAEAIERGVVDSEGTFQDAINKAYELAANNNQNKNSNMNFATIQNAFKSVFGSEVKEETLQNEASLTEQIKNAVSSQVEAAKTDLTEQINELTGKVTNLTEQLKTLTTENTNLKGQVSQLTTEKESLTNEKAALAANLETEKTAKVAAETTVKTHEATITELRAAKPAYSNSGGVDMNITQNAPPMGGVKFRN